MSSLQLRWSSVVTVISPHCCKIILILSISCLAFSNPSWRDSAKNHCALLTDPPLSTLGHRQARETAEFLGKITNSDNSINDNISVDNILVSPYLRVIQTACPTSTVLKVPICIENGLSEAHAYKSGDVLPSPQERFAYFPHIDPNHTSLLNIQPTPGYNCPLTGYPCEAFAGRYCQRMEQFAMRLERLYFGKNVILFSHAASVALVAALLRCSMRTLKFAPCGIYHLQRVNDGHGHWYATARVMGGMSKRIVLRLFHGVLARSISLRRRRERNTLAVARVSIWTILCKRRSRKCRTRNFPT